MRDQTLICVTKRECISANTISIILKKGENECI